MLKIAPEITVLCNDRAFCGSPLLREVRSVYNSFSYVTPEGGFVHAVETIR